MYNTDNLQSNLVTMQGGYRFLKWYATLKGSKNKSIFEAEDTIVTSGQLKDPEAEEFLDGIRVLSVFDEIKKELVFEKREVKNGMRFEFRIDFELYKEFLKADNPSIHARGLDKKIEEFNKDELSKMWNQLQDTKDLLKALKMSWEDIDTMSIDDVQKRLSEEIEKAEGVKS